MIIRKFGRFLQKAGDELVARSSVQTIRRLYPVAIDHRNLKDNQLKPGEGIETFDQAAYQAINQARLAHLASLDLPLEGKQVLDVGCGVGHLSQFFVERNCPVVCLDGRAENIASLHQRFPDLPAHVVDVERDPLSQFGRFDIVFAYGLLYHLENPLHALRNMASACQEMLLLETQICDHTLPIVRIEGETAAYSQALHGLGCRPSPSYIVLALKQIGFPFIYAPLQPPQHPQFQFRWKNNLDWRRNGHPLRCIFVASHVELYNPKLISLI
ncbi:MAG: class I SAM-dependent methyltransferase [Anaerolineae bacterium]|nr:class I SAM-dependent methyltransferase [Anaerolineae bacterium]